ncbi:sensor domain-containing protein [Isoptericola sp. NPDC019693]|uniref:sensor domain-containing protein n=1 Tax=Isoptericola sp. NPDC019693 TaxID=3364009 RepID=UPI0037BA7CF1
MTSTDAAAHGVDAAPALSSRAALLRAPVDPATFRALAQLAVGSGWLLMAGTVLWVSVLLCALLVPALGIGLPGLAASLFVARWFATVERGRIAVQTDVVIPSPTPPATGPVTWGRAWTLLVAPLRDPRAWAAASYALLGTLLVTVGLLLVATLAAGAVALVVVGAVTAAAASRSGWVSACPGWSCWSPRWRWRSR